MAYDLGNPHPLYGKDKNIMNEYGHTRYPKIVQHPTEKVDHPFTKQKIPLDVVVNSEKEEKEVLGTKPQGWVAQ